MYSFGQSENRKCPFCNADRGNKTEEEKIEEIMKRVEANDAGAISVVGNYYHHGRAGLQQDRKKAMEMYVRAGQLGCSKAHSHLGMLYHEGGDMKKAKFHFEAAAMAGNEGARYNLGIMEYNNGNMEQAIKHCIIAASAGDHKAMHELITFFEGGAVSRKSIDSTLTAYNNSCAEMRSEARDARIKIIIEIRRLNHL
jgi:TPR repeat protein